MSTTPEKQPAIHLLGRHRYEVRIEYRSFCLLAQPGSDADPRQGPGTDDLVESADDGLWFLSAANDHYTSVLVEQWDGDPEAPPRTDVPAKVRRFRTRSGRIVVTGIMGDVALPVIEMPPGPVTARVGCTGRAEASRRLVANEMWFRDVERWTIQLWPGR